MVDIISIKNAHDVGFENVHGIFHTDDVSRKLKLDMRDGIYLVNFMKNFEFVPMTKCLKIKEIID